MQREGAKPKSRPVEDEPQQEPMRGSIVGVRRNPSTDQKRVRRNMNKKASELDAFSVKRGVCQGEGCGVAMAMPDKSNQDLCPNCLGSKMRDVAADQDKSFFDQTKASRKTAGTMDPVECTKCGWSGNALLGHDPDNDSCPMGCGKTVVLKSNKEASRKTAENENPLGSNRNRWGQWVDGKGNAKAAEGVDRCECGSKSWKDDTCNSCGTAWSPSASWNQRTLSSLRAVGNRYPTEDSQNLPKTYGDTGGNCAWCHGSEGPVTKSYTDADEHEEAPNGTGFVPPKPQQRYMVCDSCFHEFAPENQISGKANGAVDESLNEHPMTLGFVGGAPKYCDNCEESTAHDRGTCEDCGERNPRLNEWNEYDWESKAREGSFKTAGLAHHPADVNDAFDHLTKVHGQDPGEVLNEIYEHGYHTGINDGYPNPPSDDSPGDALKAHHSGLHSIIDGGYNEHFHHDEENPVLEVDPSLVPELGEDQYNSEFGRQSSRKTATTYDVRADKLNPGDKVRDPYGGTSEVAQVRNHESGGSVYVDLKNGGTTVVDRGAQFSLVPADTRQRMIPGPGVPGGNTNANQDEAGVGNELPSSTICPVCGGKGTLHRVGDHYVCSRCGYTETAGGAGNQNYTTSPMTYQRRKTSSLLNVKENKYKQDWRSSSAIANRARAVSASEENQ